MELTRGTAMAVCMLSIVHSTAAVAGAQTMARDELIEAVGQLVDETGGAVLVGMAGREAQPVERWLVNELPAAQLIFVPVPTIGHWDQEMQRVLTAQGLTCGVRIESPEHGLWRLSRHGSCKPSAVQPVASGTTVSRPASSRPTSSSGRRSKADQTEVNLRLIHIDLPLSDDGMGLTGMGGEIRMGEQLGLMPLFQLSSQGGVTAVGLTASGRAYLVDFDRGPFMSASLGIASVSMLWDQATGFTGGAAVGAKYTFDPPLFVDISLGYQLMLIEWENYGGIGLNLGGGWAF